MPRKMLILAASGAMFILSGCALLRPISGPTPGLKPASGIQIFQPYSGLKARIAVADFEIKDARVSKPIGLGLQEMLIAALVNTNRFSVAERSDLILKAAVSEFQPQASGGRMGVGTGGGITRGLMGGLLSESLSRAYLTLDIRLLDASTSKVIFFGRVTGQASDIEGSVMSGFLRDWGLGSGLLVYANTSMEKALRLCIIETVRSLTQAIPDDYYKH